MDEAQTHSKMIKMKQTVTSGSENSGLGDAENSDVSEYFAFLCYVLCVLAQGN